MRFWGALALAILIAQTARAAGVDLVYRAGADSVRLIQRLPVARVGGVELLRLSDLARVTGATRYWRADVRKAVLKYGERKLRVTMGNRWAVLDGTPLNLRAPAHGVDGEPGIPVAAVAPLLSELTGDRFVWRQERDEIEVPAVVAARLRPAPPPAFGAIDEAPERFSATIRPLRRVVLDAGHGGDDPGARGKRGTSEATVALDVVRRLQGLLRERKIEAVLTRSADRSLTIEERAAIANGAGADLLISIHANASWAAAAEGFEVYCLGDGRIGEAASSEPIEFVPWEGAQAGHVVRSCDVARAVQLSLARRLGLRNRGVNHARLPLLRVANLPAIQVDVGFLSHPSDEALLGTAAFRQKVARAIIAGVDHYRSAETEALR